MAHSPASEFRFWKRICRIFIAPGSPSYSDLKITLAPDATQQLKILNKPSGHIYLLIGAEGGLSDEEIALSLHHGFQTIQLGGRVLRTETAALATIAALQTLWGDF